MNENTHKQSLGPLQKQWVADLRANPERQCKGILGRKDHTGDYEACCLGQLVITSYRQRFAAPPFGFDNILYENWDQIREVGENEVTADDFAQQLDDSFENYGLHNSVGRIRTELLSPEWQERLGDYHCLAQLNDNTLTWDQIADLIEDHPEAIFTRPV